MATNDLTAARLRELLAYDPETGVFTWRMAVGRWGRIPAGSVAGVRSVRGAIVIGIDKKPLYAHRLAVLYVTGNWPSGDVDHRDGNPANNAWNNLRDVLHAVNTENRRRPIKNKASGLPLGVSIDHRDGAFRADITVAGKCKSLGRHATPDAAHAAYLEAKRRLHEGCTI